MSSACFAGEKLVACADLMATRAPLEGVTAKADAGDASRLLADDLAAFLDGGKTLVAKVIDRERGAGKATGLRPKCKPTEIVKECSAQFASRTVIASCSVVIPPSASHPMGLALALTYYDALLGDGPMKACLAAKGDWRELAEDSDERTVKEHRQRYDELRKSLGSP